MTKFTFENVLQTQFNERHYYIPKVYISERQDIRMKLEKEFDG